MYDLKDQEVISQIKRLKARKVVVQLPDGLRAVGFQLARLLEKETGARIYVSADPCYGSCDIAYEARRALQADLIVHYGHSELAAADDEAVLFVEAFSDTDVEEALEKALPFLSSHTKIGLSATIQHIPALERSKRFLERAGKQVYIGQAAGRLKYDGQVLGCDYSTAHQIADKVEAFVILAGGDFHAVGLQTSTGKRTVVADPYMREARDASEKAVACQKRKMALIGKFIESKKVAILVGLKSGQTSGQQAEALKERIEKDGKECILACSREITPENLNSFTEVDLFVNTACPRIASDDYASFIKPIINSEDIIPYLSD